MEAVRILVCEDERLVARDIQKALERNGYVVTGIAANSDDALRIASETSPDLALMDIRLKGSTSGIEVAGLLADQYSIPSIYLTAYADDETLDQAKSTLPLSYLLKPFDEVELKTAIEIGLYKHREQSRVIGALQENIDKMTGIDAVERAVQLEREFMLTERTDSYIRIAGNIAQRLQDELKLAFALIEPVSDNTAIEGPYRDPLKGALIHQDRALQIVDKLLRCSSSKRLRIETCTIDSILTETLEEIRRSVRSRLRFVERFSSEQLVGIFDRVKLKEALRNIILNAYQAMEDDPVVMVSTSCVYEGFPERFNKHAIPGWYILVEILDTGKGMISEILERIFEPCFSASGLSTSTGLGLSLAYTIVQHHLGWIQVESAPEVGTKVSLCLPSLVRPKNAQMLVHGHA